MESRNGRMRPRATTQATKRAESDGLNTKGLTIAYAHPTPVAAGIDRKCADPNDPADPDLFQPTDEETLNAALAYCANCPARAMCFDLGVARNEWGVWGGVLLEDGKPQSKVRAPGRPRPIPAA